MAAGPGNTTQLQALLDSAARGQPRAYDELIAHAAERLERLARRMLRNYPQLRRWEQTDDIFQNAALRLHRSLKEVKPDSVRGFFGLAVVEIRRTLLDLIRHHFGPQGQATHHGSHDGRNDPVQFVADESESVETLELWALFHEQVAQLDPPEREVFEMIWYAGLAQAEAASMLGVSVPTVQRRLYRARHRLSQALQDRSGG